MRHPSQEGEHGFSRIFSVQKPLVIFLVGVVFFVGYRVLRESSFGEGKDATALLVPAVAWALYALWELFVVLKTPEANIRIDLLVIWPVLAILSIWFLVKALR